MYQVMFLLINEKSHQHHKIIMKLRALIFTVEPLIPDLDLGVISHLFECYKN